MSEGPRFAVVGHVEWVDFLPVERVPDPGEIVHADEPWEQAAGGGTVAAVQLAKLAGNALFLTALGDDERGRTAHDQLTQHGLEVHAAVRERPQRRAVTFLDARGERTITVMGDRLVPSAADDLPWERLRDVDGVYFTGGDAGALRAAREARMLVATPRAREAISEARVELDALVRSGGDPGEQDDPVQLGWATRYVCTTHGAAGGGYVGSEGATGSFKAPPLPGPIADAYGAGDSFAGGLTFGLGSGLGIEASLALAARCGAANLTGRGPYAGQLTAAGLT
ncbi:MAG: ribokinase [Solirubrobacteraceae bacterium]|jgi:ribokinase|nr:ribokinase [Solirubrobacteraceae bacterium]